jgi:hypothetical protein
VLRRAKNGIPVPKNSNVLLITLKNNIIEYAQNNILITNV